MTDLVWRGSRVCVPYRHTQHASCLEHEKSGLL